MRDIRSDLRERLEAAMQQRNELVAMVRSLGSPGAAPPGTLERRRVLSLPATILFFVERGDQRSSAKGVRSRFVEKDGHDWSLEDLQEHPHGVGLTTVGASGRTLNITLVNLLREGVVMRLRNGRWRYQDQATQLPLDLNASSAASIPENTDEQRAS